MKLPNPEGLLVERGKIVEYLLNPVHRFGAGKARFFVALGFRVEEWEVLAEALREHGRTNEVVQALETGFGPRYTVEGELGTPSGRRPRVRSVWQLERTANGPRLITSYPVEAES